LLGRRSTFFCACMHAKAAAIPLGLNLSRVIQVFNSLAWSALLWDISVTRGNDSLPQAFLQILLPLACRLTPRIATRTRIVTVYAH
jgi:hypothetical protein